MKTLDQVIEIATALKHNFVAELDGVLRSGWWFDWDYAKSQGWKLVGTIDANGFKAI